MEKAESDSGKSHEEQTVGYETKHEAHENAALAALPDPDAGCSDEERKRIVGLSKSA